MDIIEEYNEKVSLESMLDRLRMVVKSVEIETNQGEERSRILMLGGPSFLRERVYKVKVKLNNSRDGNELLMEMRDKLMRQEGEEFEIMLEVDGGEGVTVLISLTAPLMSERARSFSFTHNDLFEDMTITLFTKNVEVKRVGKKGLPSSAVWAGH